MKQLMILLLWSLGFTDLYSQDSVRTYKSGNYSHPTVYLVGAIHNMHLNQDNQYSINDLLAQIRAIKPDLVCGGITPEAYNQPMEGYFPPEAAFLAEMANGSWRERNRRIVEKGPVNYDNYLKVINSKRIEDLQEMIRQNINNNVAYRIPEKDLIPEGITYSSLTNSFYVSSIYKTKIIQIDAETGAFKDFIPSDLLEMRYLGMVTDETRNLLWACGNMTKNNENHSTVNKFDLTTGELLKSLSYKDTNANTYNDMVLDEDGNGYFTDSHGKCVYKIDTESDSISIFYTGEEISHPNGITISPDNHYLYIASTDQGIRVLDMQKREIIGGADSTFNSTGIDGLKYYKNSLIGIQNAVEEKTQVKIARYFLNESGTKIIKMEIIDQNNPLFDIPTTFVIVAEHLYCLANSQLKNFSSRDFKIINPEALNDVLILKYPLK